VNEFTTQDEQQPVMWLRGYPVYAAYFLALVFSVSMVVTSVIEAFNASHLLTWLPFLSANVLRGEVWRVLTYGLLNPPSLLFVVDMAMIVWFGREVEKFFGRRRFLGFYACIYLLPPLLFTLLGMWFPMQLSGEVGAFALFIAFATLYPNAMMLFGFLAKWVAAILVGIYTLMELAGRDWLGLLSLWSTVGFAFGFVRYQQGLLDLPRFGQFRHPQSSAERSPPESGRIPPPGPAKAKPMAEIDLLLDKIAQSGMASLTPKERAKLDSAREYLARRASGR
jgi:membrane associated rhomboid family serine protease